MEISQLSPEASIHGSPHDHDQEQQVIPPPARSYECNFCKKGFSNAQALGGHMNIHRKDKAKLKKLANITTTTTLTPSTSSTIMPFGIMWPSDLESPSRVSRDVSELKQLPLFVESTVRSDIYSDPIINASRNFQEELFGAELDLELRLGNDPPVSMGTRKFF